MSANNCTDWFHFGIARVCVTLVRLHNEPSLAAAIIRSLGLSKRDFACCDPYERKVIYKLFREEPALRGAK